VRLPLGAAGITTPIYRSRFEQNLYATSSADRHFIDCEFFNNTYGVVDTERMSVCFAFNFLVCSLTPHLLCC
jgi:hypothetical protein